MHPSQQLKLIALVAIGLTIASCSADPKAGSVGSLSEGIRFDHRIHEHSDGKTALTVTPVSSLVRDQMVVARETQAYAEAFASRTCPKKGYNFYAHAALASRKGEQTYVFQCN
jgi:hypothetical protein